MDKTYIHRQLELSKLGFEIDEELQQMIGKFNELVCPKKLIKEYGEYYEIEGYVYSKNGINLLFYDIKNERFFVNYHNIWSKIESEFNLNYYEIRDLLTVLLEEAFKIRVTTTITSQSLTDSISWRRLSKLE